ncbi:MAG: hypothetical protein J7M25_16410 [Deltaproteobacteria bacterium]|nr:hypothetical protein [Deltaproteobacteria bacterium]
MGIKAEVAKNGVMGRQEVDEPPWGSYHPYLAALSVWMWIEALRAGIGGGIAGHGLFGSRVVVFALFCDAAIAGVGAVLVLCSGQWTRWAASAVLFAGLVVRAILGFMLASSHRLVETAVFLSLGLAILSQVWSMSDEDKGFSAIGIPRYVAALHVLLTAIGLATLSALLLILVEPYLPAFLT